MIVILTGAGISQESGIATFRDAGGLWENERIEDVATPGGFARNPDKVLNFYNQRRRQLLDPKIAPNLAHKALARLEQECGQPFTLITQNVDDLHERAGSRAPLHMHGELLKLRCVSCDAVFRWEHDMDRSLACPACDRTKTLRPHIVWFEEMPLYMEEIQKALKRCTLFVSIGTSGNVYPAAGFASAAKRAGARLVELNLEPSQGASIFHESRYGKATEVVPAWVEAVLDRTSSA